MDNLNILDIDKRRLSLMYEIAAMLQLLENECGVTVTKATFSPTTCPVIEIAVTPFISSGNPQNK